MKKKCVPVEVGTISHGVSSLLPPMYGARDVALVVATVCQALGSISITSQ